jgi:hypothetical protein
VVSRQPTTLEEAASLASFKPQLPEFIPSDFKPHRVEHARASSNISGPEVHNDWINVFYTNSEGGILVVSQGFPAAAGMAALPGTSDSMSSRAPQDSKGTARIGDKLAHWLTVGAWPNLASDPSGRPSPNAVFVPELPKGGLILAWEVGRFGPGWSLSPNRTTVESGSPMSYAILSDSLTLPTLVMMAESVRFN